MCEGTMEKLVLSDFRYLWTKAVKISCMLRWIWPQLSLPCHQLEMSWLFLANLKGVRPNMSQIRPPQEAHALHLALLPPKSADSAGTQLKWTHFQTPVIHRGGHALISLNLSFISSEVRFRDHPKIQDSRLVGWLLLFWGLQTTTWIDFNTLPKCRKLDSSKTPCLYAKHNFTNWEK